MGKDVYKIHSQKTLSKRLISYAKPFNCNLGIDFCCSAVLEAFRALRLTKCNYAESFLPCVSVRVPFVCLIKIVDVVNKLLLSASTDGSFQLYN